MKGCGASWLRAGPCRALANDGVSQGREGGRESSCQNRTFPALCTSWLVIKVSLEGGYLSLEPGCQSW